MAFRVVSKEHTFFGHLRPHSSGCRFAPGRSFYQYCSSLFRTLGAMGKDTKGWMIDKTWTHASWLICPTHLGTVASRDDMYLRDMGWVVGRRLGYEGICGRGRWEGSLIWMEIEGGLEGGRKL